MGGRKLVIAPDGLIDHEARPAQLRLVCLDLLGCQTCPLMNTNYDRAPTDDHLRELGRIMAESAVLESVIQISIWETLKLPYWVGEQITVGENLGQLVTTMLKITPKVFTSAKDKKEFAPIAQELRAIVGIRNHVAHCFWTFRTTQNSHVVLRIEATGARL